MSLSEVLNDWKSGKWFACYEIFNKRSLDSSQPTLNIDGFDETATDYLFENNTIVCDAIQKRSGSDLNWSDYMDRFLSLYHRYRSLTSVPLDLELNVVYNLLWWFSIKSEMMKNKSLYMKNVLDVVSKSINKVLSCRGDVALGQEHCYNVRSVVQVLTRGSDILLHLSPVCSMQLLDIMTITLLILLRNHREESSAKSTSLVKKCLNQLDLLKLHLQQHVICGNEEIYFKFGLNSTNSTALLKNWPQSIDAFVIIGSLLCAVSKEYTLSMEYLKEGCESFQFLMNYIKGYCHFHLHEYNKAKLCLAYSTSSPSFTRYEGHYRLLLARVLSEQRDHQTALVHCDAVLSSCPELACHLAASVAEKLNMSTAQLMYLNKLVQSLKPSSSRKLVQFEGFDECCFAILCEQYTVTLYDAVYLLARKLFLAGFHVKALASYCELLELLKTDLVNDGQSKWLPPKIQILHEAILAHLKATEYKGGEQLCRQVMREYLPSRVGLRREECPWEPELSSLEEDVVAMTLLADILVDTDKMKALDELNRCYNALSESRDQGTSERVKVLCDWFMSRVLLRKAKLSNETDAAHYFRRALMHKPGDKEVVFHYKQWSLWHPDHQSFDPGDRGEEFPVDQLHSLALSHILGCSVTDDEWTALCEHESSLDVLESLFDDDDDG